MCPLHRGIQFSARPEGAKLQVLVCFCYAPLITDIQNVCSVEVRSLSMIDCVKLSPIRTGSRGKARKNNFLSKKNPKTQNQKKKQPVAPASGHSCPKYFSEQRSRDCLFTLSYGFLEGLSLS